MLSNKNESCVLNGGVTSKYFNLEREARQVDHIAAYLFLISLDVFFIMLRADECVKRIDIVDYTFLFSAYADETASLFPYEILNKFSTFSVFKLNKLKWECFSIGVKKWVHTALCNAKYSE